MKALEMNHLSEEMLDDVLIGLPSAEAEQHLAGCAACRARVRAFQADMSLFNAAGLAWSETRNQVSREALEAAARVPVRQALVPRMSLGMVGSAAAAAILLILGLSTWKTLHVPQEKPRVMAIYQAQDSDAQIAQDNELLREVNAAISPDDDRMVKALLGNRSTIQRKATPR